MCSRCLSKLKFQCIRFEKKHCFALVVLNWLPSCFYSGMFTPCDLYHTILLYYYAETKEMSYESVNWKGVVYKPKRNCFSLQSTTTGTGFGNVGLIFYKVHWLSCELNRKLVQSSVNWIYCCAVKELLFSKDFYQLFDSQQQAFAKHVADWCCNEFSGEARFQIFAPKWPLGNIKYFVNFKLKSLKSNGFMQNIHLSRDWPPTNKLLGSLDWFFTLETSGMGKTEKSPLHHLFPTLYKNKINHL